MRVIDEIKIMKSQEVRGVTQYDHDTIHFTHSIPKHSPNAYCVKKRVKSPYLWTLYL